MNDILAKEIQPAKAVYLAALTKKGPEILTVQPNLNISPSTLQELAFKSIPLRGKDGDFLSVSIPKYQAACIVNQVPSFKESMDERDTYVVFGLLLEENSNPIPYKNILLQIAKTCKKNNMMTYPVLKRITSHLFKSMTITQECSFTIEFKKGIKIEFDLLRDSEYSSKNKVWNNMSPTLTGKRLIGVLSVEEALEREKSSFVLDKTIIKAICSEGPVTFEDLRKKTLPLEKALGIRINASMIEEVCQRLLNEGIIKINE